MSEDSCPCELKCLCDEVGKLRSALAAEKVAHEETRAVLLREVDKYVSKYEQLDGANHPGYCLKQCLVCRAEAAEERARKAEADFEGERHLRRETEGLYGGEKELRRLDVASLTEKLKAAESANAKALEIARDVQSESCGLVHDGTECCLAEAGIANDVDDIVTALSKLSPGAAEKTP